QALRVALFHSAASPRLDFAFQALEKRTRGDALVTNTRRVEVTKKTARLPRVTRRSDRIGHHQQRVGVAIDVELANEERMPARFPLLPDPAARSAIKSGAARLQRFGNRLLVYKSAHPHLTGQSVLHHGGHQPVLIEPQGIHRRDHTPPSSG